MATIGQALTAPESGWRRLDDRDQNITYIGTWTPTTATGGWLTTQTFSTVTNTKIKFNFTGTSFRFIGNIYGNRTTTADLYIDGVKAITLNQYGPSTPSKTQIMQYDTSSLEDKEHYVEIVNNATGGYGGYFSIDAIDIGSTNYLRPYNENPTQIIRSNVESMQIGDLIPCNYTATSGACGPFSELGICVSDEIPYAGTATPNGLFFFIKADKGMLVADRVIQTNISWDALNSNRIPDGCPIQQDIKNKLPLCLFTMQSNTNFYDLISVSILGTINGSPALVPGVRGNALPFNGSTQNIACNAKIIPIGAKSIRFKIKVASIPTVNRYILGQIYDSTTQYGTFGYVTTNGTVGVNIGKSSAVNLISTVTTISLCDNAWHEILFTWDGTTTANAVKLYLDGVLNGTFTAVQAETVAPSYNLYIGSLYNTLGNSLIGSIDEFEVYDKVIQPTTFLDCKIRLLTGGDAYLGTDGKASLTDKGLGAWPTNNEWDTYIVNGTLGGKITPGDDEIWHKDSTFSICQDTPITNLSRVGDSYKGSPTGRVIRSKINTWTIFTYQTSDLNTSTGFRPVLEYPEDVRSTTLWY